MEIAAFMEELHRKMDARNPRDITRGKALENLRVAVRVSMRDLAIKLGCSPTQISAWETGLIPISNDERRAFTNALDDLNGS
jgi:transcriptional regulator with XRE-family HTH domain